MRNTWLMGAFIAAFSLADSAYADTILLARMTSPSEQHHTAERTDDPAAEPKKPTTIGAETLRKLMATIAPKETATRDHHTEKAASVKAKHTKPKKSAKKQRSHKHAYAAHRKAANQPQVLGGIAPARLKPCHHAHPVPAFLRHDAPATPAQPAAPWQTRQLRFGPRS